MSRPGSFRILLALLALGAGILEPGLLAQRQQAGDPDPAAVPAVIDGDASLELFRTQLLQYVHDSEATMTAALDHPLIGEELRAQIAGEVFQLPIPDEIYRSIAGLNSEDLDHVRTAFDRTIGTFEAPTALAAALGSLERIPRAQPRERFGLATFAGSCGTNYVEFDNVLAKLQVQRALNRAQGGIKLGSKVSEKIGDILRASLEDVPVIGSKLVVVFHVIWGVTHVTQTALGIASSAIGLDIAESQLCLASCLSDSADAAHPDLDSGVWRGKGCDNRDNNCDAQGIIDEPSEDRFKPEVFVDSSALLRCYDSQAAADAAARRAVTAADDCSLSGGPSVNVAAVACAAQVTAGASDGGGNQSVPKTFSLRVDGDAPVIGVPSLNTCYASLALAREALAATPVADACGGFSMDLRAAEKECVANLELEAVDECGNRASTLESVRLDGASPEVRIETLKVPSVKGLACFASEAAAVATVAGATLFSDNCTARERLASAVTTSGDACNLTVTSTVGDECAGVTTVPVSDSLLVRVDTQAPAISCSVATPILWPADGSMVDIGFQLSLTDNCDPQPTLEVTVTSDESTRYAYVTQNGNDPFPDAVVQRTPAGGIQSIQLRAQRRMTNVGSFDGRVYRIRVVATDACGLSSRTECWAQVPSTSGSTAVNSGQDYDATTEN